MMKQYAYFLGLCMELVGLIVVFLYLGRAFDDYMQWKGLGIISAMAIAMSIWIFHLSIAMKNLNKEEPPNDGR